MQANQEPRVEVVLSELIGPDCITFEDGKQVFDLVHPAIKASKSVIIDFTGVEVFASPFFNAAFGALLQDTSDATLSDLMTFKAIGPEASVVLQQVLDNARQYFDNPSVRDIVSRSIRELAEQR